MKGEKLINIAICDDNPQICDSIEDILFYYSKAHSVDMEIFHFYTVESLEFSISRGNHYHLIYLDIEFPEKSGIELANFIRNIHQDIGTELIFISGSNAYFKKLLDFQPISFISKPFEKEDVIKAFELFLKRKNFLNLNFSYKKSGETYIIPLNEITHFESMGKKVYIHTEKKIDFFYGNISDVENRLKGVNFYKIHRSFIVNSIKVCTVKKDSLILNDGIELPIGRTYQGIIKDKFLSSKRSL